VVDDDSVLFIMDSRSQIVGDGVSKVEDGINITGSANIVYMSLSFEEIFVVGGEEFGKGHRTVTVRNEGFNSTTHKQMIYISTKP
jgi:hypothetical protein